MTFSSTGRENRMSLPRHYWDREDRIRWHKHAKRKNAKRHTLRTFRTGK